MICLTKRQLKNIVKDKDLHYNNYVEIKSQGIYTVINNPQNSSIEKTFNKEKLINLTAKIIGIHTLFIGLILYYKEDIGMPALISLCIAGFFIIVKHWKGR